MVQKLLLFTVAACGAWAQSSMDAWRKPFPAHTIAGNLHYVGTAELACFLITTPAGHILINTGLDDSAAAIRKSVEDLGFRFGDIRILLTTQAHFDHTAALAEIKKQTSAKMFATAADKPLLEDGGRSDYFFTSDRFRFAPVAVDRVLANGDTVELGGAVLRVHLTPGHTRGSVTYTMQAGGKAVVIANMGSINEGVPLKGNVKYPAIAEDYGRTFRVQKSLACDIFVASHASQYDMAAKFARRDFVDPEGYRRAVDNYEQQFRRLLAAAP